MLARRQRLEVRGLQVHHGGALFSGVVGLGKGLAVHLDALEGAERRGGTEYQAVVAAGIIRGGLVGAVQLSGDAGGGGVVIVRTGHRIAVFVVLGNLRAAVDGHISGIGVLDGDAAGNILQFRITLGDRHGTAGGRLGRRRFHSLLTHIVGGFAGGGNIGCGRAFCHIVFYVVGESTAGDGELVSGILKRIFRLVGIVERIRFQCLAVLRGKAAVLYLNLAKILIAVPVHYGDSRAVLNGAVVFGLGNRSAGNVDGAVAGDLQTAGADLHAHGLGVDDAVFNVQRTAAGEVDAEAVGHVQRTILQRNGIVGVVAIGLDTAVAVGRHGDLLEHQTGVIVGSATLNGGDQTHHRTADHSTVLHG